MSDAKVTKVFITGDRQIDPITSAMVTVKVLQRLAKKFGKVEVYTGCFETGIERAVRYVIKDAEVIFHDLDDAGYANLDARHATVKDTVDVAVMIHSNPLQSRIGKSLADHFPGDNLIFA